MDPTKENILCKKGSVEKYFSQRQLDLTGQSPDGSFDGWVPQHKKPVGIPDSIVLPLEGNATGAGDLTITVAPTEVDPNFIATSANPEPLAVPVEANVVPVEPVAPEVVAKPAADPAKTEKVKKNG